MIRPSLRFLVVALVVALALSACGGAAPAAEVDGETITSDQLAADTALFEFLTAISGSPCGQPADGESQDSACARLTLTNLIQEDLIKHYATRNGIRTDPQQVTEAIGRIEGSLGGPQELDRQLAERDLTRGDLVTLATRLLLFNTVRDAIAAERLTDERVQQIYEQSVGDYTLVEVSHILVGTEAEADEIAAEATPENFARLARQRSQDTASAQGGGSLGPLVESAFRAQYDPTFVEATLGLQPGQISAPVQTSFGWHVIYLAARDVAPIEDVRDQILASASSQVFAEWMRERLRTADIEVNPRYGALDRSTGEVRPVRSTDADEASSPAAAP